VDPDWIIAADLDDDHVATLDLHVQKRIAAQALDHQHLAGDLAVVAAVHMLGPEADGDGSAAADAVRLDRHSSFGRAGVRNGAHRDR
jgi:hypothetical protein